MRYSTELAALIAEHYGFTVGAACFPEVHPEAESLESDLRFLKEKVDAGARFLITQLFFDNALYFNWVDQARAAGIDLPIIPGIIPITNLDQIKRFTQTIHASIPANLLEQLEARADEEGAVAELGVAYATCSAPTSSRPARRGSTSTR